MNVTNVDTEVINNNPGYVDWIIIATAPNVVKINKDEYLEATFLFILKNISNKQ